MQQNKGKVQNNQLAMMQPQAAQLPATPHTALQAGNSVSRWIAQYNQEVNMYAV